MASETALPDPVAPAEFVPDEIAPSLPARAPAGVADDVLDRVFRDARTPTRWAEAALPEGLLNRLYELVKLGPTSGNCSPARFVFLESRDSRERLRPALSAGNVDPTLTAAVTVIV